MIVRKLFKHGIVNRNTMIQTYSVLEDSLKNSSNTPNITRTDQVDIKEFPTSLPDPDNSVLEPLNEDISYISPYLKPTFNFAAYINKSETLQELVKLGVDLHKIEKNVEAMPFILGLKFEDIREHIIFLSNFGLKTEKIGDLISKNPFILKEDLENLKIRINYLQYKKFTDEMILHIVETNPYWLTHSTQQIDESLGFFQNQFELNGNEIRLLATKAPKLITYPANKIKLNIFVMKEEMGFTQEELKQIILSKPKIFTKGQERMLQTFDFLHKEMNISLEKILQAPEILTCRKKRLMERHLFLVKLGKAQYDPKIPNYIALTTLVSGTDSYFSTEVAKSSIQTYNTFLKSL